MVARICLMTNSFRSHGLRSPAVIWRSIEPYADREGRVQSAVQPGFRASSDDVQA